MPTKTTRLTILIDSETKQKLENLSEETDLTISQVIRKLIRDHLHDYENESSAPSKLRVKESAPA
ncbi:ribbon-helix-helix domain-containing protein [Pseudomonas sp. CCC3.1]|uniref:ribbon-helix-helix domain-containing protein n=1 Tax=Pseudomonas sp. CCC3.1 TaxID=3048607 RepID=UPI002AC8E61B|nr:ribbon-helix-helix domain-containing protein [Pseudomonas sp. CCC3.1]MEB0207037.1 ribbon-helix-helix domain-containing protein [Pseudomonas sp. CCC3.1]WPX35148.1 ribbon-helix-helix domain-containing protein [Pseudomonas sp. CCC3.1]